MNKADARKAARLFVAENIHAMLMNMSPATCLDDRGNIPSSPDGRMIVEEINNLIDRLMK